MNIIDLNTIYGAGTDSAFENTAQNLCDTLKNNGISKGLTLNKCGVIHNFNEGNEITLNDVSTCDNLLPLGTIDPRGFFGEKKILEDLKSKGFKAIKFFPHLQNWHYDNIVFKEIMEINKEVKLPVIITTKNFGDISSFEKVYNNDFPVVCSMVSYENATEFVAFAKKYDNVYVETSAFKAHYVLDKIVTQIGIDRVMFGSNSPYDLPKVSIDLINTSQLSSEDKEKIFISNASKIF